MPNVRWAYLLKSPGETSWVSAGFRGSLLLCAVESPFNRALTAPFTIVVESAKRWISCDDAPLRHPDVQMSSHEFVDAALCVALRCTSVDRLSSTPAAQAPVPAGPSVVYRSICICGASNDKRCRRRKSFAHSPATRVPERDLNHDVQWKGSKRDCSTCCPPLRWYAVRGRSQACFRLPDQFKLRTATLRLRSGSHRRKLLEPPSRDAPTSFSAESGAQAAG